MGQSPPRESLSSTKCKALFL